MTKKIVIVENEKIVYNLLSDKFKEEGYEPIVVENFKEAVNTIKKERPALVALALPPKEKDAFETIKEIKNFQETASIPIIVISNSGRPSEIEKAKSLGARDWLIKTKFNIPEVLEKVKKQIS